MYVFSYHIILYIYIYTYIHISIVYPPNPILIVKAQHVLVDFGPWDG